MNNRFMKLFCSIPVILALLFFLPPLGVIVFLLRYVVYGNRHFFRAPVCIMIFALIITIPFCLNWLINTLRLSFNIPYLQDIINSEYYSRLLEFARFSFITAAIVLIVTFLLRNIIEQISSKLSRLISGYYSDLQKRDEKIAKENDLKLKEKAITSKQKTPHAVKCPHCGKTNSIIGTVGKCKSCRSVIEYKG